MFDLLRQRNLALFFSGQFISLLGDFVLFVALPFWIYQLTGSATATGIMFAALTIPQLFLSPIAGVFVDRWDRKKTMIVSDLLRACIMGAYLIVQSPQQAWIIYVLAFAESSVSRFFQPAATALIPTLVPAERLAQANATLGVGDALARLAGPALGGILVATSGPHGAAVFDALTFLFSAAAIQWMHVPHFERPRAHAGGLAASLKAVGRELAEGVRFVAGRPLLRVLFLSVGVFMLSQGIINVLIVVLVKSIWGAGAAELGYIISAQGLGAVMGAALISSVAARVSPRWLVVGGAILVGGFLLFIINQPSIYLAIAVIVIPGMLIVAVEVGWTTLMQLGSDDANRGRVASLFSTVIAASMLLSIGFTSALADRVGALPMLDLAALTMVAAGVVALLLPSTRADSSPLLAGSTGD